MPAFATLLHLTGDDAAKSESHPIITDGRAGADAFARRRDWSALLDPLDAGLRDELLKYGDLMQATYDASDRRHWSPHCGTCVHDLRRLLPVLGLAGHGYVATAFLYATSDVDELARLVTHFRARGEEVRVTVTGHSLGGALAMLATQDAAVAHPDVHVSAVTFGAPCVGNRAFCDGVTSRGVRALRVVVRHDVVPHPIPEWWYTPAPANKGLRRDASGRWILEREQDDQPVPDDWLPLSELD
ncbi:phospholipase A1-Igamma1, chloroplastic-like [Miscanthus floridulus]|uniref:phospholipase A1-Igamma1, chloroplastic-like n=1 Tax=Miscanthus floridulus TaxID=154761 RepID=UPI00345A508B